MGLCGSRVDKHGDVSLPRKNSSLPTDNRAISSAKHDEFVASNWKYDLQEIWARNIGELPVHSDLPRLAQKLTIIDKSGKELKMTKTSKHELCLEIIECLAGLAESDELAQKLNNSYFDHVKQDGSGDVSQQLRNFLVKEVKGTKLDPLLRCCHQKLIFPSFYSIRDTLKGFDLKDMRGTWFLTIDFSGKQTQVIHKKQQASKIYAPESTVAPEFSFEWQLVMQLADDLYSLDSIEVGICNVDIHADIQAKRKTKIRKTFEKHYNLQSSSIN